MKAYLIDSKRCEVTEVEYDNTLDHIHQLLDSDMVDAVRLSHDDVVYVDDKGLYRKNTYFVIEGIPNPLAGNGLVLGTDLDGYSVEPVNSIETISDMVKFIDYEEALRMAELLDIEGHEQEQRYKEQGGIGFMYIPIAGILKAARYTEESN